METFQPKLRFQNFEDKWTEDIIKNLVSRYINPVKVDSNREYQQIGIRSHGKGLFHKDFVTGESLGNKRVFWIIENALIINIVFAWEQAVAKTTDKEIGMIASHRFPMYLPLENKSNIDFLNYFFLTKKGKFLLENASPGGAGRNKTLGQKEFDNSKIIIPSILEQTKIANFLSSVDEKLNLLKEKKELLLEYKKGIMQKIFNQEIRFKDDNGNDFEDWDNKTLGECLSFEQPTKYLVNSTDYNDNFETPVLTAGKTFILGYTDEVNGIFKKEELPVIIFDDFTTATQFVDFPFKAKSSAMKILKAKENINIKFVYEAMQNLKFEVGGHGRHWISIYSNLYIDLPSLSEQTKIANFLSAIDEKIELVSNQIQDTQEYKKGLLQQMFV